MVFGVSGSGKTLIGKILAERLRIEFIEGDDFHPDANIAKMKSGHPLVDADRMPWLNILEKKIAQKASNSQSFVMSCSALKIRYRDVLRKGGNIIFLFLNVAEKVVAERLNNRKHHFMPAALLHSQIETLEYPQENERDIIEIDASQTPEKIVEDILGKILP